ncbi:uroporphyrinogen-III C-methyltransferase [Candidatus Nitrosotenuis cloacae]|uniref:uroporphyrinogen-III C-methyltransferase n=1 Tax=Candidatus Nitrosotenuis cloacae TaxID=1603555 RepID=UPI002282E025|nr:uroporphyrinogen-III C-methyltransferase [Candidatus Nitrosotenuis cloacae]
MSGTVYLVGAGPGDEKLITVRAVELIKSADAVLYDRLVSDKIVALIPKKAHKVYVGREVGDDYKHQDSTNKMMVDLAKKHKRVVRLKGGDPFIFGRGGEEAEYLRKYKIKFEIIPGITSGIGSAVYSGIPLTHRKYSSSVVFVTGHEDPMKTKSPVRWRTLAKSVETIVIMMGLSRIGIISKELIAGGLAKSTPVAVIQNGTTTKHRLVVGTLSNIEKKIQQNQITPPSIIIIGNVVKLHKTVGWK